MSKKANRKISIHRAKRNLTKTLFINRTIGKLDWRLFINRECPSGGFYISMEKSGQFLSFGTREIFHRRFLSMWKVRGGFYQSGTGISSIVAFYQSGKGKPGIVAFYQSGNGATVHSRILSIGDEQTRNRRILSIGKRGNHL